MDEYFKKRIRKLIKHLVSEAKTWNMISWDMKLTISLFKKKLINKLMSSIWAQGGQSGILIILIFARCNIEQDALKEFWIIGPHWLRFRQQVYKFYALYVVIR